MSGLIAVIAGCTIALGGAYLYRTAEPGGDAPIQTSHVDLPLAGSTEKAESTSGGKKLTYARLTPDGPVDGSPAVPSVRADPPRPRGGAPDNRSGEPLAEGKQPENASSITKTAAVQRQAANQRTVVRSEIYLPDGTRIDNPRPAPVPSIVRLDAAKARPPFLAAAQPPEAAAGAAPKEAGSAPAAGPGVANSAPPARLVEAYTAPAPELVQPNTAPATGLAEAKSTPATELTEPNNAVAAPAQPAEPAAPSDSGYFAQFKADQDQKAAEAELAAISEKYKAVLGEVPLKTRSVDLKEKGVWIRVLAGPLKSRDDVMSLCKKLKSAGLEACIVQKLD